MELMVRIVSVDGRTTDLVAAVERSHTVNDLFVALTRQPSIEVGVALYRHSTGSFMDPDERLSDIGLVSGEVLTFTGSAVPADELRRDEPSIRVEAVGGPASGWRAEFAAGTYTLGRPFPQAESDPAYRAIPDGAISRSHVTVRVDDDQSVTVEENPAATNRLLIDGAPAAAGPQRVVPGQELRVGDSVLVLSTIEARPPVVLDQLGQVAFHRTPLRPARPQQVDLPELAKVPSTPEPARFSWISAIAPVIGGVVMALVIGEPRFLLFTAMAPITGGANWFETRRKSGDRFEREVDAFERKFAEREIAYSQAYADEETLRLEAAPDIADLRRRAELRDKSLWSRGRDVEEFLSLRVGKGPADALIAAPHGADGDQEFVDRLEELEEQFARFDRVPVTVPLAEIGILGIHGPVAEVASVGQSLLVQAATLHSPEDLVIAAAAGDEMGLTDWLTWMPHTRATGSPISGPHLASDPASTASLLRAVLEVAEFRDANQGHGVDRRWPWVLLAIDRLLEPDAHLVAQILDRGRDVGISVLWLSDDAARIPPQARAVAELADRRETGAEQLSRLWFTDPDVDNQRFSADGVDPSLPDQIARSLAPLRDASSNTSTSSIPRVVPLLAAHQIDDVTPQWIQEQWAIDRIGPGGYAVQSVVGITVDGPLTLDLVSDGPHGLIGGTSGAGKSELIQALVVGLIAYQSPEDLALIFIDFKVGSASEMFKDLPHVAGRVTDLDESLAIRAQVSLRAELRRRGALFNEFGVKDMAEFRSKHPGQAPPSLVIVIDEFATLVKQLPEFVAEIIDIAQRGRSYGVHLIMATQRPSSSVDDNILANTNLRISLRMLDRAESMAILNAPDAAEIPVPLRGRCIARMGPGQLVEFQSAYCSAPLTPDTGPPPVHLTPLGSEEIGTMAVAGQAVVRNDDGEIRTQQDDVIDAVMAIGAPRVMQIWNDLLPEHLAFTAADRMRRVPGYERAPGRLVLLGGTDDPARQTQYAAVVDLDEGGGLLVLGTGGSGKTQVLRTAAASIAVDDQRAGGGAAAICVLDFASGELRDLRRLPQVQAVGTLDDLEAATRIIQTLSAEVARRRGGAADGGAVTDPRIVLLVDGYTNLADALSNTKQGQEQATDEWIEAFHRIVLDGRQVGIHTIMTADRAASIRNSVFAAMTNRFVMKLVDEGETSVLGVPSTRTMPPGGGYLSGLRVQIATLGAGDPEPTASEKFSAIIDVAPIELIGPSLPEHVDPIAPEVSPSRWTGAVGVADITGAPVPFDCSSLDLLVSGPPQSGKSWALRAIAEQVAASGIPVYAAGSEDSGLRSFDWDVAGWGLDGLQEVLASMQAQLEFPDREAFLVLDDLDLLENPAFDSAAMGLGTNRSIRVAGSASSFGYSNNELVKRTRAARQVLYLQPGSSREVAEVIGVMRLPLLRLGLRFPPGRGMWVRNRIPTVVQTVMPESGR